MQVHQLARIVFVEAFETPFGVRRADAAAEPIVPIELHGRMMRHRSQQLAEIAERIGPDRLVLEIGNPIAVPALAFENIEMVEPELGHHFLQLPRTFCRQPDSRLMRLRRHFARGALTRAVLFFRGGVVRRE